MKKFEKDGDVILLMTKDEATDLYKTLAATNEELRIVVATGKGTECVTECDGTICAEAQKGLNPLRYALGDINPMAELAKKYAHPEVYNNGTEGYIEIDALGEDDWQSFLDELAHYGLTCSYCNACDTFTIG